MRLLLFGRPLSTILGFLREHDISESHLVFLPPLSTVGPSYGAVVTDIIHTSPSNVFALEQVGAA